MNQNKVILGNMTLIKVMMGYMTLNKVIMGTMIIMTMIEVMMGNLAPGSNIICLPANTFQNIKEGLRN